MRTRCAQGGDDEAGKKWPLAPLLVAGPCFATPSYAVLKPGTETAYNGGGRGRGGGRVVAVLAKAQG
eukprot:1792495-Rhodomonas_salina.1